MNEEQSVNDSRRSHHSEAGTDESSHGRGISLGFVVGLLVAVAAVAFIILDGADDAVYAYTVDQAVAQSKDLHGKQFRVRGIVKQDSIESQPGTLNTRFALVHANEVITISFDKALPDTFAVGAEVIAQGTLGDDGVLAADEVIAKCPSKYDKAAPTSVKDAPLDPTLP